MKFTDLLSKEMETLNEGLEVKDFDKKVKEIAKLTDINDHTTAMIKGLELIKGDSNRVEELLRKMKSIKAKHEQLGHMPKDLMDKREKIRKEMERIAKNVLTKDQYTKFYNAF